MQNQKLTTATAIAAHIQHLLPHIKGGTLRFWGVWFGRPYDNQHTIVRAEAEGDRLTIYFNEEEKLQIWQAAGCKIDSQQFLIQSASRILWSWYYYGRPHTADNLRSEEFIGKGGHIEFKTTFPYPTLQGKEPNPFEPAVHIY